MLAYRRRKALLDWLTGHGSLTVSQAASRLKVSEVTVTLQSLVALAESIVVLLDGNGGAGQALDGVAPPGAIDHVILEEHVPSNFVDELRGAGMTVSLCGSAVARQRERV